VGKENENVGTDAFSDAPLAATTVDAPDPESDSNVDVFAADDVALNRGRDDLDKLESPNEKSGTAGFSSGADLGTDLVSPKENNGAAGSFVGLG
jgi:hypothetical protein